MNKAKSITIEKGVLVVKFNQGYLMAAKVASTPNKKYPNTFAKALLQHNSIRFDNEKNIEGVVSEITLGNCYFEFDIYDEGDEVYELFKNKESSLICALHERDVADWIYHPELKNSGGEFALFPVIHEEEDQINPVEENVGVLFISAIAKKLGIKTAAPTPLRQV